MGMKLCLEQRIYIFHSYEELEVKHKKAEERIKELSAQVRSADDNNNTTGAYFLPNFLNYYYRVCQKKELVVKFQYLRK